MHELKLVRNPLQEENRTLLRRPLITLVSFTALMRPEELGIVYSLPSSSSW